MFRVCIKLIRERFPQHLKYCWYLILILFLWRMCKHRAHSKAREFSSWITSSSQRQPRKKIKWNYPQNISLRNHYSETKHLSCPNIKCVNNSVFFSLKTDHVPKVVWIMSFFCTRPDEKNKLLNAPYPF